METKEQQIVVPQTPDKPEEFPSHICHETHEAAEFMANLCFEQITSETIQDFWSVMRACDADMKKQGMFHWDGYEEHQRNILDYCEVYIVRHEGKAIGSVAILFYKGEFWIKSLAVLPEFQLKKVGSHLLRFAESQIRAEGGREAVLDYIQYPDKNSLQRFYESNGYEYDGELPDENNPEQTAIFMKKYLFPRMITQEEQLKIAIDILRSNLEKSGLDPDYPEAEMIARREYLKQITEHLPEIAARTLEKLKALLKEMNIPSGKLCFFVVGGRVRVTPIKDNTDFDIVITSENSLNPRKENAIITYPQRHALFRALYAEIENIFHELQIPFSKGIIEFKGMGENTENEHTSTQEYSMKIGEWE